MSKNKLLEFMQKETPSKKSKEEIFELHNSGYAMQQIVEYLKVSYQLITSRQTLSNFIKKEKK